MTCAVHGQAAPELLIQTLEEGDRNTVELANTGCKIISRCILTHGPQVLMGEAASREDNGSPGSGTSRLGPKRSHAA